MAHVAISGDNIRVINRPNVKQLFVQDKDIFTFFEIFPLPVGIYTLDRFTKTVFWNFQSIPADLCYILIYKQMLEKVFCSNIATPPLNKKIDFGNSHLQVLAQ